MPASKIYRASEIKVLSIGDEYCLNVIAKDGNELLIHFRDADELVHRIFDAQKANHVMTQKMRWSEQSIEVVR